MKPSATFPCLLALAVPLFAQCQSRPNGDLKIDTSLVREGARPLLHWEISFPMDKVGSLIEIESDNGLRAMAPVEMRVRVLSADYQPYGEDAAVNFQVKVGEESWSTIFHGTDDMIDASETLYTAKIAPDTVIDFAGAGNLSQTRWTTSRNTLTPTRHLVALRDGDSVPDSLPVFRQGVIKDHLSAYIHDDKIVLSPNEVIYLIELGQNDPRSEGFDLQDLIAIASFAPIPEGAVDSDDGDYADLPAIPLSPTTFPGQNNHKPLRSR